MPKTSLEVKRTFTVLKEMVSVYAVQVEAANATEAILQAYDNNHEPGDLINDFTQNETMWEVVEGPAPYPLEDEDASLPRDEQVIDAYINRKR